MCRNLVLACLTQFLQDSKLILRIFGLTWKLSKKCAFMLVCFCTSPSNSFNTSDFADNNLITHALWPFINHNESADSDKEKSAISYRLCIDMQRFTFVICWITVQSCVSLQYNHLIYMDCVSTSPLKSAKHQCKAFFFSFRFHRNCVYWLNSWTLWIANTGATAPM